MICFTYKYIPLWVVYNIVSTEIKIYYQYIVQNNINISFIFFFANIWKRQTIFYKVKLNTMNRLMKRYQSIAYAIQMFHIVEYRIHYQLMINQPVVYFCVYQYQEVVTLCRSIWHIKEAVRTTQDSVK